MPSSICKNCIRRLGIAYQFKQQCENSDMRLRECLGLELINVHDIDSSTNPSALTLITTTNGNKMNDDNLMVASAAVATNVAVIDKTTNVVKQEKQVIS